MSAVGRACRNPHFWVVTVALLDEHPRAVLRQGQLCERFARTCDQWQVHTISSAATGIPDGLPLQETFLSGLKLRQLLRSFVREQQACLRLAPTDVLLKELQLDRIVRQRDQLHAQSPIHVVSWAYGVDLGLRAE